MTKHLDYKINGVERTFVFMLSGWPEIQVAKMSELEKIFTDKFGHFHIDPAPEFNILKDDPEFYTKICVMLSEGILENYMDKYGDDLEFDELLIDCKEITPVTIA